MLDYIIYQSCELHFIYFAFVFSAVKASQKCNYFFLIPCGTIAFNASWEFIFLWPLPIPEKYSSRHMVNFFGRHQSTAKAAQWILFQKILFMRSLFFSHSIHIQKIKKSFSSSTATQSA